MSNVLSPPATLLVKLGSIARHVEELCGPQPHVLDQHALKALLDDPEVQEWMKAADGMALLPVLRNAA
jgi:hypothetical protein